MGLTRCYVCRYTFADLERHLAFAHGEVTLLQLDPPVQPAPEPEPAWIPALYSLLAFAALALVASA